MKKVVGRGGFTTCGKFVRAAASEHIDEELTGDLGEAEAFRAAWEEGISSGPAREVDFEALKAAGRNILKAARA
ncbi:hypothetical protein [Tahibacter soli]|uniref:Uncharacterized protein n=1 Tax=Tahibacter soli TaxID=2983605 RepID=A0A9X3YNW3_9GAMM|nr:hypothetical protein [Tahibacter soli]MDC8015122.1 hypothetical protein [Tahibacter soli]